MSATAGPDVVPRLFIDQKTPRSALPILYKRAAIDRTLMEFVAEARWTLGQIFLSLGPYREDVVVWTLGTIW